MIASIILSIFMVIAVLLVSGMHEELMSLLPTKKNREQKQMSLLSWPAAQILAEYNALPVDNRPEPDIKKILMALDVKHGGRDAVNRHFSLTYSGGHSWGHHCRHECNDYKNLKEEIFEVAEALKEREQALKIAAVRGRLDEAQDLIVRLSEESSIIKDTTKELKGTL